MGIHKHSGSSSLGPISSQFFSFFFFFSAKMNLTVFAVILLAITMATARRASLGEKTMQAAGEADEPEEARPASLVEKIKRANGANGAEKKEIKAEMADDDKEDEAESGEVDDAKSNEVDLRQRAPSKEYCDRCEPLNICLDYCIEEQGNSNDKQRQADATLSEEAAKSLETRKFIRSEIKAYLSDAERCKEGCRKLGRIQWGISWG